MKKFLAFFLALVMVLSLCACGGKKDTEKDPESRVLTIGHGTDAMITDWKDNSLTKWIEETLNCELQFIEYAGGTDVATQIATTIAANQELPDIIIGTKLQDNQRKMYGDDGYFLDLSEYYNDKEGKAKNFWERLNVFPESVQTDIVNAMTEDDGAIYGAPTVENSIIDMKSFQAFINVKWLDRVNMQKPTDAESLYQVLKAFKEKDANGNGDPNDEIPLMGSQRISMCATPIDWLINLFTYFMRGSAYSVDDNGKLSTTYTLNEYREALKYINKLYKEGLMNDLTWTATKYELQQINTPATGTTLSGVFLGHLSSHVIPESELLYEYEPLDLYKYVTRRSPSINIATYITEDCDNPDLAFEMLMLLVTEEGCLRARYGEPGKNWTPAAEGTTSFFGFPATFELIEDPHSVQNNVRWGSMPGIINPYGEAENSVVSDKMSKWMQYKFKLHGEIEQIYVEHEKDTPKNVCPTLEYTTEELEKIEMTRTNVNNCWTTAQTEFCTGKRDPNSDADWNAYLKELNDLGVKDCLDLAQTVYDRMTKG